MNRPIVIVGIGELGGVFAKAFLRNNYPVYPVTRSMNISDQAVRMPQPELVLVAVAEKDFKAVMTTIPGAWRNCTGLIQNELLPETGRLMISPSPRSYPSGLKKRKDGSTRC